MNTDELKNRMARLPEEDQDALATFAAREIKKRSELEQAAAGSMWFKPMPGLIFPLVVSVAIIGFRDDLADLLPLIIIFLLAVILGVSASVHSRIDAIHELMRIDREGSQAGGNQDGSGVRE